MASANSIRILVLKATKELSSRLASVRYVGLQVLTAKNSFCVSVSRIRFVSSLPAFMNESVFGHLQSCKPILTSLQVHVCMALCSLLSNCFLHAGSLRQLLLPTHIIPAILTPLQAGYDLTIGISEEGVQREAAELVLPRYQHALVVFGGAKVRTWIIARDASINPHPVAAA